MGIVEKRTAFIMLFTAFMLFMFLILVLHNTVTKIDAINHNGVVVLCDRGQITIVDQGRVTQTEVQCSDRTQVYFAPEQDDHESSEQREGEQKSQAP